MLKAFRYGGPLAITSVLSLASVAFAEEFSLPAIDCVEPDSNIHYSGGNAENPRDTIDANFRCPIFRRAPDSSSITDIRVEVDDQHPGENVECFVRSCNPDGSSCNSGSSDSSWIRNTLFPGDGVGHTDGYAYLNCVVPDVFTPALPQPNRVLSYRWVD